MGLKLVGLVFVATCLLTGCPRRMKPGEAGENLPGPAASAASGTQAELVVKIPVETTRKKKGSGKAELKIDSAE